MTAGRAGLVMLAGALILGALALWWRYGELVVLAGATYGACPADGAGEQALEQIVDRALVRRLGVAVDDGTAVVDHALQLHRMQFGDFTKLVQVPVLEREPRQAHPGLDDQHADLHRNLVEALADSRRRQFVRFDCEAREGQATAVEVLQ